jgi:ABC-2 type transport system permease protein
MQKYLTIYRFSFLHGLKNYKNLIGLSVFLITCLIIFSNLWQLAAAKLGATQYDPSQLIWYIAFNEWVLVSLPDTQDDMEQDLRTGRLAYLLPRPISYLGSVFAEAAGTLTLNLLVLGIITFVFTYFQIGSFPFNIWTFSCSILFGLFAGIVGIFFLMIIGLSAFWLTEVTPFFWIWEKFLFMLGGLMLPLAVYPEWIQKIASFTPFPSILGERSALAISFTSQSVLSVALSLFIWGIIGFFFLLMIYRKGLKILNIKGG